jgi:U3 small nucleolar RNA-associated protein 10
VDWPDLGRYLAALVAQRDHVTGSSSYLLHFHAEHLTKAKGEGKKESSYKQRILCYLLSHVQACPLPTLQTALLRSLSHVSSPVKVEMLFDLISDTIKKEKNVLENSYAEDAESFVKYLIGSFDSSACILLQEPGGKEWMLFCQVLTRLFRPGLVARLMCPPYADTYDRVLFLSQGSDCLCYRAWCVQRTRS